jgi:hypothetical protein
MEEEAEAHRHGSMYVVESRASCGLDQFLIYGLWVPLTDQ